MILINYKGLIRKSRKFVLSDPKKIMIGDMVTIPNGDFKIQTQIPIPEFTARTWLDALGISFSFSKKASTGYSPPAKLYDSPRRIESKKSSDWEPGRLVIGIDENGTLIILNKKDDEVILETIS